MIPEKAIEKVQEALARRDYRSAVDQAKELHRNWGTESTERLLVQAYGERIRDLRVRGLTQEADTLRELVRNRYPGSAFRLDASPPKVLGWAAVLADPGLSAEDRDRIHGRIVSEVTDPRALAAVLPEGHPLRQVAESVWSAFERATSQRTEDSDVLLPDISRRSPFAPWKSLIRAISAFYRKDDETAAQHLAAIPANAAVEPLAAVLSSTMKDDEPGPKGRTLSLRNLISPRPGSENLASLLKSVDKALREDAESKLMKAVAAAVKECEISAPTLLERLRAHILAKTTVRPVDTRNLMRAMGVTDLIPNAYLTRLTARAAELIQHHERAAREWQRFRKAAVVEGWIKPGREEAVILIHAATVQARMFEDYAQDAHGVFGAACELDPSAGNFSAWVKALSERFPKAAEEAATEWRRVRPTDIEPVLFRLQQFETRNALQKAEKELATAEALAPMNPGVRNARLRLLIKILHRHLNTRNRRLADRDLADFEAATQFRMADLPALLPALTHEVRLVFDGSVDAREPRGQIAALLGEPAAALLLYAVGTVFRPASHLPPPDTFPPEQRQRIPEAMIRVYLIMRAISAVLPVPEPWAKELSGILRSGALRAAMQLRQLGELALRGAQPELTYAISAAGLALGGPTEGRFLYLRSRAVPPHQQHRRACVVAASLSLARQVQDAETINDCLRMSEGSFGTRQLSQALFDIVRKQEREATQYPNSRQTGPDYRKHDPSWSDFRSFDSSSGAGRPDQAFAALLEELAEALESGEPPEEFTRRVFGRGGGRGRRR